jgi:hypothetical protein
MDMDMADTNVFVQPVLGSIDDITTVPLGPTCDG